MTSFALRNRAAHEARGAIFFHVDRSPHSKHGAPSLRGATISIPCSFVRSFAPMFSIPYPLQSIVATPTSSQERGSEEFLITDVLEFRPEPAELWPRLWIVTFVSCAGSAPPTPPTSKSEQQRSPFRSIESPPPATFAIDSHRSPPYADKRERVSWALSSVYRWRYRFRTYLSRNQGFKPSSHRTWSQAHVLSSDRQREQEPASKLLLYGWRKKHGLNQGMAQQLNTGGTWGGGGISLRKFVSRVRGWPHAYGRWRRGCSGRLVGIARSNYWRSR